MFVEPYKHLHDFRFHWLKNDFLQYKRTGCTLLKPGLGTTHKRNKLKCLLPCPSNIQRGENHSSFHYWTGSIFIEIWSSLRGNRKVYSRFSWKLFCHAMSCWQTEGQPFSLWNYNDNMIQNHFNQLVLIVMLPSK